MGKQVSVWTIACAVGLVGPAIVLGDYYDNYNDGYLTRDPNDPRYDANDPYWTDPNNCVLWDCDNPDWTSDPLLSTEPRGMYVASGWFRMYGTNTMAPYVFLAGYVEDGDHDANTSVTYYDNKAPHYLVTKARSNPEDPNDAGGSYTLMHATPWDWKAYCFEIQYIDFNLLFTNFIGTDYIFGEERYAEQGPNGPAIDNGFWMLLQFDPLGDNWVPGSPNDPNDPNCHWLRGAWWNGGKHDWNGEYWIQMCVLDHGWGGERLFTEGGDGFAAGGTEFVGMYPDVGWDNTESRWGSFTTGSAWLNLSAKDGHRGKVTVDPDIMDKDISLDPSTVDQYDPNNWGDPNDIDEPRRYTKGTGVVLTAEAFKGKFTKWKVKGPNDANDPSYQESIDTNSVLYLTMDGDYAVKAVFKCGGGGVEPFAGMVLMVLGLGVVIRRLA